MGSEDLRVLYVICPLSADFIIMKVSIFIVLGLFRENVAEISRTMKPLLDLHEQTV